MGLSLPATAPAQGADVRVELNAERVVLADNKQSLVAADKAKPGDVIE